jgi:hypothetical protein
MDWVVKLSEHGGQYRVTLPRELLKKAELLEAELLRLEWFPLGTIVIQEYHGKRQEKTDIPGDQS